MATHFFWDPVEDNIVQERDDAGGVTAEYATEPYLYGNLISQNRGGVESQYHFDSQGSTLALTDDNAQVTDTYGYSAFGELTAKSGTTINPFRYVGRKGYYRHNDPPEHTIRRRFLSAAGRWLSVDPLDVWNYQGLYRYVLNRPTIYTDASGTKIDEKLCCECEMLKFGVRDDKGFYSITVPRSDGKKPDRTCPISISCEPNADCDGLPGSTHIKQRKSGEWYITICISCRYRPTHLVFFHEMHHAALFCSEPETYNDDKRKMFTCMECKSFESDAHNVNCNMAFQDKESREICVKCGAEISCSIPCHGRREGPWSITLESGEQHRCNIDKDLGGVWLPAS